VDNKSAEKYVQFPLKMFFKSYFFA